ncbi:MAG: sigma 54-interacting transcriptional regulator [Myxococcales bacterium]|jgi:PAS domain S-box-containing protein
MGAQEDDGEQLSELTARVGRMLRMSHFTVEHAVDAILWIDSSGRVRRANATVEQVYGYGLGDLPTLHVQELLAEGDGRPWLPGRGEGEARRHFEARVRTRGGDELPVDVAITEIEQDGERFACAFLRDITDLKHTEARLREALSEVEALKNRLQAENVYLQDEIRREHDFDEIVGQSEALSRVLVSVQDVAETDATVLILGESGTGKELVARAIHGRSPRRDRPLVKVNCAALPANLIESELFGHEKGAFTGAVARRVGRFELADRGTIFLDEVGELPLELQAKLLRVLQEGELERLGDARPRRVDVRVIAATNQALAESVERGRFRADLYYRLNVFPIEMPPLRERRGDVRLLAHHFARKYGRKLGRAVERIPEAAMGELEAYPWPGNVRELQNVIERAVIVSRGRELALAAPLLAPAPRPGQDGAVASAASPGKAGPAPTLGEVEQTMIREALTACGGVIGGKRGAAARLGIPPSTLRERMRKYGIERPGRGR